MLSVLLQARQLRSHLNIVHISFGIDQDPFDYRERCLWQLSSLCHRNFTRGRPLRALPWSDTKSDMSRAICRNQLLCLRHPKEALQNTFKQEEISKIATLLIGSAAISSTATFPLR